MAKKAKVAKKSKAPRSKAEQIAYHTKRRNIGLGLGLTLFQPALGYAAYHGVKAHELQNPTKTTKTPTKHQGRQPVKTKGRVKQK
jgi:hypothetical protein